jgi:hypothetical protein
LVEIYEVTDFTKYVVEKSRNFFPENFGYFLVLHSKLEN